MTDKTPDDVFKIVKDEGVEFVDVRFCDLPGTMQHFTIPVSFFDESVFEDGLAFDGSSIRGFQSIHESDMLLLPDPVTARIDAFRAAKTLNLNFFVHDPFTLEPYSRDPRNVARKAENYLISTGIADTAYFGAEAEFYIFDSVSFDSRTNGSFYEVDAIAGWWNTGAPNEADGSPNRGYKVRPKGGYFPVAPVDHYVDLRDTMLRNLINAGFSLEKGHHEVGTGGRPRSTTSSTRCCTRPTTYSYTSTSSRTPRGRRARPSRSCPSRCSVTTARACTPTSRCGRTAAR
ncbi:glutamine synthetase 1 [Mycobacterium kansasii]|uniref:Glutamine synthetase n=1 Tax=Mycobacterium kansasii TaxID=1768 RepID=A0A1V3WYQ6_MYCKA|nr:glutamine synthetase 1 [Mycobacterium kansasii]